MGSPVTSEDIQAIIASAEKLLKEAHKLRADVSTLAERIEPFEDEQSFGIPDSRRILTVKDAMVCISESRAAISGATYDLAAIRSKIDQIANDSWSREDIKPYIRSHPRPRGR